MMPDLYIVTLAGLGLLVLLVAWLPMVLRRAPLSLPIICVLAGYLAFSLPVAGPAPFPLWFPVATERLTEFVVIVALMGAGLKLDRPFGWHGWRQVWRLLGIAMPLTILATAALGWWWLGLGPAAALLLGAALAPTDPVLAADVQVGPPRSGEEDDVRFGLTAEAGLNDGLAFPFVNLAIVAALAAGTAGPWTAAFTGWVLVDVAWKLAAGIGIGWAAGHVLGWATFRAHARARLSRTGDGFVALGIMLLVYGVTEMAHGYGFVAVFVAALALRAAEREHDYHDTMHAFIEQAERLLMMLTLVLFGGVIAQGLFTSLTWAEAGVAIAIVFLVRPILGWISLAGLSWPRRERALVAFLGVRGIGSFYYIAYALNHAPFPEGVQLWSVVGFVVLLSVVVHGVTVTPLMRGLDIQDGRNLDP
ncbi:cation:proton antiporter [Inquilinus sp. 2KB_23]